MEGLNQAKQIIKIDFISFGFLWLHLMTTDLFIGLLLKAIL